MNLTTENLKQIVIRQNMDLVVIDLDLMDETTNFDVNQFIAEQEKLPIVCLTAISSQQTVIETTTSIRINFLEKPFSLNELRLTIETSLYKFRIDEEYRHKKEHLNLVIDGAGLGTWDANLETERIVFNQHWITVLGFDEKETEHSVEDWLMRIHPDDLAHVRQKAEQHFNGLTAHYSTEHRILTKSGRWKWIHDSGKVTSRAADGKPLRMVGVCEDIDERKETELKLQNNEQNFSNFFNLGIDLHWVLDKNGLVLACNKAVTERLGYQQSEIIGMSVLDFHPPQYRAEAAQIIADILQNKRQHCPILLLTKSGTEIPVETYVCQGKWNGKTAILAVSKDISALKLSEEKFSSLFHNSPAMMGLSDLNTGEYLEVNQMFLDCFGYTREEVIGRTPVELGILPASARVKLARKLEQRSTLNNEEIPLKTRNGLTCHGLLSAETISIQDKKYNFSTVLDITQRKQAEDALKRSHNQLEEILNSINANVSVVAIDNHEILFMNQRMIEEFGQDFTGQTCWSALRQQKQPCLVCNKNHLVDQQEEPTTAQTWESNFGKTEKPYLMNDRAIRWHDGRVVRLQISTDISHIRRMENQLRQKHKMEAIGVMAGGIAHNFNNNLAIILGSLEMAQRKINDSEKVSHYIENAKVAILHSRDLVQQIMTYSSTTLLNHKNNTNELNGMVGDCLELIKTTLPSSIRLNWYKTAPHGNLNININASQFQEVLINLCNNAVMAMDEIGELTITTGPAEIKKNKIPPHFKCTAGRYALLSVKDSGCGMGQEVLARIFDPFFSTKDLTIGTGMGLATVEGIMKQNQGFITVNSEPGAGSIFSLYFPQVVAPRTSSVKYGTGQSLRGNERILLVDDDSALVELNTQLLSGLGYKVNKQSSSKAALDLFKTDPNGFDLVITDQTMPELTGGQLITELQKIQPQVRTILCTGFSNVISEESAKELGISAFLMKPTKMDELSRVIRSVFDS